MGYGYDLTTLAKAFVFIAILVGMVDCVTLFTVTIAEKIPYLPDEYHWTISYGFSCALGAWICWQGHFDLFSLSGLFDWWQYHWLGYLLTGCIIGGGSKRLFSYFRNIKAIPSPVIGNTYSNYGGLSSDFDSIPNDTTSSPTPNSDQKGEI